MMSLMLGCHNLTCHSRSLIPLKLTFAPDVVQGCTTASAQKYIAETKEALDFQDSKVAELAAGTAIFSLATPNFPDLTQARKV